MDTIKGLMFVRKIESHAILLAVVKADSIPSLKGEHQYIITGEDKGVFSSLQIHNDKGVDISAIAQGNSPDGLLREPIWQT